MQAKNIHIAGINFQRGAKEILEGLAEGSELELKPEPENHYDSNAVQVLSGGVLVGYVPRDWSEKVAGQIQSGLAVAAELRSSKKTMRLFFEEAGDDTTG